jgi:hypothetical protein
MSASGADYVEYYLIGSISSTSIECISMCLAQPPCSGVEYTVDPPGVTDGSNKCNLYRFANGPLTDRNNHGPDRNTWIRPYNWSKSPNINMSVHADTHIRSQKI